MKFLDVFFSYHPMERVFIRVSRWFDGGVCIEIGPWMWLIRKAVKYNGK